VGPYDGDLAALNAVDDLHSWECARGGVQACTPKGVQRGVQNQWFVRVACVVRNPKLVHPQFLPATKLNVQLNERLNDQRVLAKAEALESFRRSATTAFEPLLKGPYTLSAT
jgi:hypothetical protein